MSSPHHHHHHPHPHPHPHYYSSCCSSSSYCSSAASCCCCSCCNSSSPPPSLPPPPSDTTAAATDPLLHALANHLLLLHQSPKPSPPPPPPHLYSYPHLKPYPSPQTHQPPPHDHHHQQQLLHSLLRRISALESSLPHLSPPPHPPPLHAHSKRSPSPKKHLFSPPPPPPPPPPKLQDLAARTIQTHFRLFLVRRSQTLRHLKRLASIKSHVAALRSSLSDKTHLHPAALSESAMALLLELDAIQGGDPMIREGKRSISRELTRILDFVDKVLVKEKELMEIAENAYEVIPPTRTGKKVSFFDKEKGGKRSPVSSASHEPFSENRHLSLRLRRVSEENGIDGSHRQLNSDEEEEEEEEELENSSESNSESSKAKLGLSAPLPLQMEPRRLTASR